MKFENVYLLFLSRILAEVNVLCTSEQGAQWVPLIDSLIPIHATNTQVSV